MSGKVFVQWFMIIKGRVKWEKKGMEGVWKGNEGEHGRGMRRNGE